ncbi:MAG: 16S rRNA (cytosine(967)-C(5))-methyltransferase RsmB [Oscillospiraceae bacterium]
MKTTRQITFDTLMRVFYDGAYSNIAIDKAITEQKFSKTDAAFTTALYYGVLERAIQLDFAISKYLKKPITSIDKEIILILRIGFYQLLYMNGVPDNSSVDESVKLCPYAKKTSAKSFVNAVLRNFLRDKKQIEYPDIKKDELAYYSAFYACPRWLLGLWRKQYGIENAVEFAKAGLISPPLTIRVNTLKTTSDKLIGYLLNKGINAKKHPLLSECLILTQSGSIDKSPQYRQGLFYVQDIASQLCAMELAVSKGDTVLDICSAPGSKAFTIAQEMENDGVIYAFDLFEHKLKLIEQSAKRLDISIIKTAIQDGSIFNKEILLADKVLCDVPCSGLGIIRRKPEIKYKTYDEIADLPEIQFAILQNSSKYVKSGGTIIYSTCTLNKHENQEIVMKFLENNSDFSIGTLSETVNNIANIDNGFATFFPSENGDNGASDGFFIAKLIKK